MKYWNEQGRYQEEYQEYFNKLVPETGNADTDEGNALIAISKIYHDVFNNGAGNIVDEDEDYDDWDELVTEYSINRWWKERFRTLGNFISYVHVNNLERKVIEYVQFDRDGGLADMLDDTIDMVVQKIGNQLVTEKT